MRAGRRLRGRGGRRAESRLSWVSIPRASVGDRALAAHATKRGMEASDDLLAETCPPLIYRLRAEARRHLSTGYAPKRAEQRRSGSASLEAVAAVDGSRPGRL